MTKLCRWGIVLLGVWLLASAALADAPKLTLEKIVGDLRGRVMPGQGVSVTADDAGNAYLLSTMSTVARFDADGQYVKTVKLSVQMNNYRYISAVGSRVFVGDYQEDYPWVFGPEHAGTKPGRFAHPVMVARDAASGAVYVVDTDNQRIQRFPKGETSTPDLVLPLAVKPMAASVRGTQLAVLTVDHVITVYDLSGATPVPGPTRKLAGQTKAIALGPQGTLVVAFQSGQFAKYAVGGGTIADVKLLSASGQDQWPQLFPAAVPLITGPDGLIWFATQGYGKLLSLDPATDTVTDNGPIPGSTNAIAWDSEGRLYTTGQGRGVNPGPAISVFEMPGPKLLGPLPTNGSLTFTGPVGLWGLLATGDGGVYVRIVEPNRNGPTLNLKRVYPDGTIKPFAELTSLSAGARFAPWDLFYSLELDTAHNVVLTSIYLESVLKLSPDGKVIWRAGYRPTGGSDAAEFDAPRDLALDSTGRIWVADGRKNQLFCFSPEGKLLLTYGHFGGIDDGTGEGFDNPTGIATAQVQGVDYLYVGDAGNLRILKYRIN